MEEENRESEEKGYVPRPRWQLWAARIGLAFFILLVILQIYNMVGGRF